MKKIYLLAICILTFCYSSFSQTKGLLISEVLTNPNGNDSPFEYVELLATTSINFASTPYTVVFTDNGTATSNGWRAGGSVTYAFLINSGSVTAGQVVYVGGTSMAPLSNGGVALKSKNTSTTNGDSFGNKNSLGINGNGGSNCDGVAVFNVAASSITSSTVPVDAIFYGNSIGSAYVNSTSGYQLPINDKYSGGKLKTNSYIAADPGSDDLVKATSGVFNPTTNTFTTSRVWSVTSSTSYNTSSITLTTGGNSAPTITLNTPTISGAAPATVSLSATASDIDGTISNVEFYNGTTLIGSDLTSPYSFSWTNVAAGTYSITAKATDNLGLVSTSNLISITVSSTGTNQAPTLSFNTTASPYVNLSSGVVSCVINNNTDPFIINGLDINVTDDNLSTIVFSMTSTNVSVLPNANFTITGTGTARKFKINPIGVGYTTVTLKVTDAQGLNKSISLNVAVSNAYTTSSVKDVYHTGVADGSTGIAVDANYMFVADDETNVIKLYNRNNSGLSIYQFDVNPYLNLGGTEVDMEASFRSPTNPNRIYWMGSLSNSKTGQARPDRNRIFATDIVGTGANATLVFVGYYSNLRSRLISWGDANGYNFTAKAATGIEPKRIDGFNIEGMEIAPDGTTLYIGFRAPFVGSGTNKALICPLLNFESWFGNGSPNTNPIFGSPIELNLNNHGIRSIAKNASNNYIIAAGSYDNLGTFELYSWNGNSSTAPTLLNSNISNLKPEGIIEVPASITGTFSLTLISDLGAEIIYNDGLENKDVVQPNHRKFMSSVINVTASPRLSDLTNFNNQIIFYPNPVSSELNINFRFDNQIDINISILNTIGEIVKSQSISQYNSTIEMSTLPNGMYFVKSNVSNEIYKVIKL